MSFAALVLAALDAGGHAPTSPAAVYALDRSRDVAMVVNRAEEFADHYRRRNLPRVIDRTDAALGLAIVAIAETARGVRALPPRVPK